MKEKKVELPGPDHPISIQRKWLLVLSSQLQAGVVADTDNALTLREADYPAVQYIPREDVDFSQLERTDHATYCPYKGECSYYSVPAGGEKSVNAVWTYDGSISRRCPHQGTRRVLSGSRRRDNRAIREGVMSQTIQEKNKALVLDAFDTLFNKRNYAAAEKYWSPNYIQHSAHIERRVAMDCSIWSATHRHAALRASAHRSRRRLRSSCTDDSQGPAGLLPGSPRILSGLKTAA